MAEGKRGGQTRKGTGNSEQCSLRALVEQEAAARGVAPRNLWLRTFDAILGEHLTAEVPPNQSIQRWREVISQARAATADNWDPANARWTQVIALDRKAFFRWLNRSPRSIGKTVAAPRGPKIGTTGLAKADRELFPKIDELLRERKVGSSYAAARLLDQQRALLGGGTPESRAKRLSGRYLRERRTNR